MQNGFIQLHRPNDQAIRAELTAGLLAPRAWIAPKFKYDALGTRLLAAICELPEYYLARTEAAIIEQHLSAIARAVGRGRTLIDLGAGNCERAARLFPILQPAQYVPVDSVVDFLKDAVERLRHRYPRLAVVALGMDFADRLELPDAVREAKRLFLYPGSSIGNFTPDQARMFLGRIREACKRDGGLLIGVDLVKRAALLQAAYGDAIGLLAAFSLNLLRHVNHWLGTDFDPRDWRHGAVYNEGQGRIDMSVTAVRNVTVHWNDGEPRERRFWQSQSIHTESSYKYTQEQFLQMLERAGFAGIEAWTDPQQWFMVCHARAV